MIKNFSPWLDLVIAPKTTLTASACGGRIVSSKTG